MQIINTPLNVRGRLVENSASNFTIAPTFPYPLQLTPSAAVQPTNPVCSLDNSTISDNVLWTDGRPLLCCGFCYQRCCITFGW